jgi:hypothetical protein
MSEPDRGKTLRQATVPQDGNGSGVEKPENRHCGFCGAEGDDDGLRAERFGEVFCSDGHAEEFVKEVRAHRVQAAARFLVAPESETEKTETAAADAAGPQGWKRYLKMAVCCGAPLLALVFLAGGGGALLGGAAAILPFLAFLACPLAMYFMMRGMTKMEQHKKPNEPGEEK